jgi:hypothetical protein
MGTGVDGTYLSYAAADPATGIAQEIRANAHPRRAHSVVSASDIPRITEAVSSLSVDSTMDAVARATVHSIRTLASVPHARIKSTPPR